MVRKWRLIIIIFFFIKLLNWTLYGNNSTYIVLRSSHYNRLKRRRNCLPQFLLWGIQKKVKAKILPLFTRKTVMSHHRSFQKYLAGTKSKRSWGEQRRAVGAGQREASNDAWMLISGHFVSNTQALNWHTLIQDVSSGRGRWTCTWFLGWRGHCPSIFLLEYIYIWKMSLFTQIVPDLAP